MIFFCNAQGTITSVVSSPVYQGSNYANEVVFVAPFASASVVTVSFILPNGAYTTAGLMTSTPTSNVVDDNNVAYNAWTYLVPSAFTEYSGTMTAQFAITIGTTVNKTASSSFTVQKGVPNITTDPPEDIYQQILTALSSANTQINNLNQSVNSLDQSVNNLNQSVDGLEENKLDKQTMSSGQYRAYVVTPDGNQGTIGIIDGSVSSAEQLANNIARYDSFGRLATSTPTENQHATNKQYVDAADENLSNEIKTLRQDIDSKSHFRGYLTTAEIQSLPNPDNGDYAWSSDTLTVWSYNGSQWVNTGNPVPDQTVPKGETTPLPDAESGSAGASTSYAAIDHVHPKSDIYASAEEFSGLNTDYQAFKTNQTTINSSVSNTLQQLASDIVTSETQTGAFINGQNTLNGVEASVEVQSENLIPFPYQNTGGDSGDFGNGVTYSVSEDGGILFNGTVPQESFTDFFVLAAKVGNNKLPVGKYTLSCNNIPEKFRVAFIRYYDDGTNILTTLSVGNYSQIIDYTSNVTNYELYCAVDAGCTINQNVYVKLQYGETATSYTKPLIVGTPVNITACGKNLFNNAGTVAKTSGADRQSFTNNSVVVECLAQNKSLFIGYQIPNIPIGTKVTLKGSWVSSGQNDGYIRLWWATDSAYLSVIGEVGTSGSSSTFNITTPSDNSAKLYLLLYGSTAQIANIGDTVTYTNVQLEIGEIATDFEPYENQDYSSQVGQTIDVTQYDDITNIFATTEGAAVSTQFLLSTKYELETKPVSLAGTYANRPTGTYPYVVLYTATDSGATYRLEANTDGSVSGNWISISNRLYRHNIGFNGNGPGIYYYCTILTLDSEAYKTVSEIANGLIGTNIHLQEDGVPVVCYANPNSDPIIVLNFLGGNSVQLTNLDGSQENISITVRYDAVS